MKSRSASETDPIHELAQSDPTNLEFCGLDWVIELDLFYFYAPNCNWTG